MGRLGADASRIVEAARALARERRHRLVEPEHLLAALLRDDRVERVLGARALDRQSLEERTALRLADWPAAGLYRDADAEPVPSDALESLLARAGMVAQAETLALARGEGSVSLFHLLHVLVEQAAMTKAFDEIGVDTAVLVVKTCPASEARTSIEKGRAKARTAAMPLRISWRPHTSPSQPDYDDA